MPTLLVWGTDDKYIGVEEADEAAARNPSVISLRKVDGAGHCVSEDWPERVLAAIIPFLTSR